VPNLATPCQNAATLCKGGHDSHRNRGATGRVLVTMNDVKLENRNLRAVQSQIAALRADSA